MDEPRDFGLECVDPQIGARALELLNETAAPADRELLEAHVEVCSYCRLAFDLEHDLSGSAENKVVKRRRVYRRARLILGSSAMASAAASMACLLLLPPRPLGPVVTQRGEDAPRFLRPIEGEVVDPSGLTIRWTEIEDVESYRVSLSEVGGDERWIVSSSEPVIQTGSESDLAAGQDYRLLLSTVPSDLVPTGGVSVGFKVGSEFDVLKHRIRQGQPLAYAFALASLLAALTLGALFWRRSD